MERLSANVLFVHHWDRLLGGVLYAATPRMDWARLLRRSLDVLKCPKCDGRLGVVAAITERASVARILAHIGVPTEAPAVARARDPTDDVGGRPAKCSSNSRSGSAGRGNRRSERRGFPRRGSKAHPASDNPSRASLGLLVRLCRSFGVVGIGHDV